MKRARTFTAALVVGALALSVSACGSDGGPTAGGRATSITIGSLQSAESQIVAQLYGQALAEEGYAVDYNPGIGDRTAYLKALKSGVIDVVPETIGSLLSALDPGARYSQRSVIISAIDTLLEDQVVEGEEDQQLQLLNPAPAEDTYSFVITKAFARTHNLVTLRDLAQIAPGIAIGAATGFDALPFGRTGLDRSYGVRDWRFVPFESDDAQPMIEALVEDSVQVIAVQSTSSNISRDDLVVLGDPNGLVVAQNIAPLVREKSYSERLGAVLNAISKRFTTADLRSLTAATADGSESYEQAARRWLIDKRLIADN
ncbi:MAG: ABC transporter substrate-binding protein [Microbacteriaceae bacterium]